MEAERLTLKPENGNGPLQSNVTVTVAVVLFEPLAGFVTAPLEGSTETVKSYTYTVTVVLFETPPPTPVTVTV